MSILGQHNGVNNNQIIHLTDVYVYCTGIYWDMWYLITINSWFQYPRYNFHGHNWFKVKYESKTGLHVHKSISLDEEEEFVLFFLLEKKIFQQ